MLCVDNSISVASASIDVRERTLPRGGGDTGPESKYFAIVNAEAKYGSK
jgi:hypothetical protein